MRAWNVLQIIRDPRFLNLRNNLPYILIGIAIGLTVEYLIKSPVPAETASVAAVQPTIHIVEHIASHITAQYEGVKLEAYHDIAGYATQGYGHLLSHVRKADLSQWPPITMQKAKEWLYEDLETARTAVDEYVTVSLTLNQRAALTDFVFNEGAGAFHRSTLLQRINEGRMEDVPHEFRRWVYAGGHKVEQLAERREAEITLWQGED